MEIKQQSVETPLPSDPENNVWEKRSKIFGSDPKGVLFKGLPDLFNEHIHEWQLKRIVSEIDKKIDYLSILDIGCGYGRIAIPVLKGFPCAKITGIDISANYVELFRENTGQNAFVSKVENINPDLGLFDYIFCVTVLMYVRKNNIVTTLRKIIKLLNNKGKLLLIEPCHSGSYFQTCFGLLNLLQKNKNSNSITTGGHSFKYHFINDVIEKAGAKIIKEYRMPATTLFFLAIYLFTRFFPAKGRFLLNTISKADELFKISKLPSIYIFYVIEKQEP